MPVLSPLMIQLTKAGPADAVAISQLAEKIWRIHYPPIIGHEQVEYMLKNMHSAEKVAEQMKNGQVFSFITDGDERIGYTSWSIPKEGELFISKFYIDPEKQGKGIGKKVFAEILELNPEVKSISLTVNRKNFKSTIN